jgi:hypothetical protein
MKQPNKSDELKRVGKKLPHGSKQKIAVAIGEPHGNVQTAFRGLAGEELSKRVWKEAKKYLPKKGKGRKMSAAA